MTEKLNEKKVLKQTKELKDAINQPVWPETQEALDKVGNRLSSLEWQEKIEFQQNLLKSLSKAATWLDNYFDTPDGKAALTLLSEKGTEAEKLRLEQLLHATDNFEKFEEEKQVLLETKDALANLDIGVDYNQRFNAFAYIQDLFHLELDSLNKQTDYKDQQQNLATIRQKHQAFLKKDGMYDFLVDIPNKQREQHTKLVQMLQSRGERVNERKIHREIISETKKMISSLWNEKQVDLSINQFAAHLYQKQTGGVWDEGEKRTTDAYTVSASYETSTETVSRKDAIKWVRKEIMQHLNWDRKFSKEERKLMKLFSDLTLELNYTGNDQKTPEKILLDHILKNPNAAIWYTRSEWEHVLEKRLNLQFDKKSKFAEFFGARGLDDFQKFAQAVVAVKDISDDTYLQYPGFRRMLSLIDQEGSFDKAYNKYKTQQDILDPFVKNFKTPEKRFTVLIGKEPGYNGLYEDVSTNIDTQIKMLADFNLDGRVDRWDAANKTGLQLQNLFSSDEIQKTKQMDHLIAAFNKGKNIALTKEELFSDFDKFSQLQNFVKNPPMDLHLLLNYGAGAVEEQANSLEYEKLLDAWVAKEWEEIANQISTHPDGTPWKAELQELIKDKKKFYLGLKDIVEGQLVSMGYNGAAAGAQMKLIQWVLGDLSLNVALSNPKNFSDISDYKEALAINLSLNNTISNKTGKSGINYGLSAGTVLLTVPIVSGNIGVYTTSENKQILNQKKSDIVRNAGVGAFTTPALSWRSIHAGIDTDRAQTIERKHDELQILLNRFGSKLLDSMQTADHKFEFDAGKLREFLDENFKAEGKKTKNKDLNDAVKNMTPLLQFYNGADLSNEDMKTFVVSEIAESFALSRRNQAMEKQDGNRYISWWGLSLTFLAGVIPIVGLLKFKKHSITGYSDTAESVFAAWAAENLGAGNRYHEGNNLNHLANELSLGENAFETIENSDYISFDSQALFQSNIEIRVSQAMKGLMKKNWNKIILHKNTPLRAVSQSLGDSSRKVLNIWSDISQDSDVILNKNRGFDTIPDFFVNDEIDPNKLPEVLAGFSEVKFTRTFNALKDHVKDLSTKELLNKVSLVKESGNFYLINENLDKDNAKYKIPLNPNKNLLIKVNEDATISFEEKDRDGTNFGMRLEIKGRTIEWETIDVEMKTQTQIDNFYGQMTKIKNNTLAMIAHHPEKYGLNSDMNAWRNALNKLDFDEANTVMIAMLPKIKRFLQRTGNVVDFSQQVNFLKDKKTETNARNQLLLALDGMFSRTSNVRGDGKGGYTLVYGEKSDKNTFGNIVSYNASAVVNKMKKDKLDDEVVSVYSNLFGKMNEKYKKLPPKTNAVMEKGLAYNFGNGADNQRPIINPYIVESTKSKVEEMLGKNELLLLKEQLAWEIVGKDRATIQPMLNELYHQIGQSLNDNQLKQLISKNRLDIDDKISIKSKYDLDAAIFAQCVNHMVVLSGLKFIVEIKWENIQNESYDEKIVGETTIVNTAETNSESKTTTQEFAVAAWVSIDTGGQDIGEGGKTEQEGGTWEWTWDGGDPEGWDTDQRWNTWEWTWGGGDNEGTGGGGR